MSPIAWKPEYSVGNPAVDHEHQELVDLVNQTAAAIIDRRPDSDIERAFGDLLRAVSAHFALEEQQMQRHGYDQTDLHKNDHERLLDELRELMDLAEDLSSSEAGDRLVSTLEDWFSNHFRKHDSRLHNRLGSHSHP